MKPAKLKDEWISRTAKKAGFTDLCSWSQYHEFQDDESGRIIFFSSLIIHFPYSSWETIGKRRQVESIQLENWVLAAVVRLKVIYDGEQVPGNK